MIFHCCRTIHKHDSNDFFSKILIVLLINYFYDYSKNNKQFIETNLKNVRISNTI